MRLRNKASLLVLVPIIALGCADVAGIEPAQLGAYQPDAPNAGNAGSGGSSSSGAGGTQSPKPGTGGTHTGAGGTSDPPAAGGTASVSGSASGATGGALPAQGGGAGSSGSSGADATGGSGSAGASGATGSGGTESAGGTAGSSGTESTGGTAGSVNASGGTGGTLAGSGGTGQEDPTGGSAGSSTSGSGGSAGSGGEAGSSSSPACDDGFCESCPASMATVEAGALGYCIDRYEVTNAEYNAFIDERSSAWPLARQPAACAFNTSFAPDPGCDSALDDPVSAVEPVRCVDWCDAHTYCASLGLHLCGRLGGMPNRLDDAASPEADQWYLACAGSEQNEYPYGADYAPATCNGSEYAPTKPGPKSAATFPDCTGHVASVANLSGNVAEWNDTCSGTAGAADGCVARGGSYLDGPYELRCEPASTRPRSTQAEHLGFRCCAELVTQ
jgi:formylglycine-generating enzyme